MDAPLSPPQARPDPKRWLRLARKELREILRDRRTLLTLALMPLLLYPLLGFAFSYAYGDKGAGDSKAPVYRLGFDSRDAAALFKEFLEVGDALVTGRTPGGTAIAGPGEDLIPKVEMYPLNSHLAEALRWGQVDLAVYPHLTEKINKSGRRDRTMEYEIAFDPDSAAAKEALRYVHGRLIAANLSLLEEGLKQRNGEAPPRIVRVLPKPTPRDTHRRGFLLAVLVPLVLILMTMTGAVYPAIDLTAGERERGTLEMLMATPISRVGLLAAKYLAVVTVAVLTAIMNLLMMAVTTAVMFAIFGSGLGSPSELGVSLGMIPVVLFLVILFAAFYAAVLLVVAGFARSFKEAQAYIVPLTLVSLVPGLSALLPDLPLNYLTALVPLLNIVLLARDLLSGYSDVGLILVVVAATMVYGYLALVLASRTFGAEAVLYSDGRSWRDWIRRRT
jgi:ABC-2 type transport system permease protein/sodium transport system permease protein